MLVDRLACDTDRLSSRAQVSNDKAQLKMLQIFKESSKTGKDIFEIYLCGTSGDAQRNARVASREGFRAPWCRRGDRIRLVGGSDRRVDVDGVARDDIR